MKTEITRRLFMAGTTAAASLVGAGASHAAAVSSAPTVRSYFGPEPGIALLSRNENPFGPAPSALAAIADCAKQGCYYADKGVAHLADMIAERHRVSPKQVVIGSGSTEILSAIALAWGKDGTILCPGLFWDTTVKYGEAKGVKAVRVPLAADMNVDLAALSAALTDDVSLVQICNPNNPTGMALDDAALRALAARVVPQATLLIDEAYNEFTDDPARVSLVDMVREGKDVIICRTFSKIYGMAGMRVGYAITSEANAARINGYLMSFGGNVAGLAGAIASYDDETFLAQSRANVLEGRQMILDAVARAGLSALQSQANFVFVKVPDADAVQRAMAARGVMIRGAYGPWTQYSRVSTGRMDDVRRYAQALPEVIGGLRG